MNDKQQIQKESAYNDDPRIDLAVERTMLAMERTQLAWARTVLGLITGGVAIDRGIAALHEARMAAGVALVNNAHFAGLLLTSTGTLLMIITTGIYIRRMKQLNLMNGIKKKWPAPGTILSVFICLLGGFAIWFLSSGS
jgi:uncharacterized membrane protein YidH (DUF202 family)